MLWSAIHSEFVIAAYGLSALVLIVLAAVIIQRDWHNHRAVEKLTKVAQDKASRT